MNSRYSLGNPPTLPRGNVLNFMAHLKTNTMSKKKQISGERFEKKLDQLLKITKAGRTKSRYLGTVRLKDGSKAYVIIGIQPDKVPYA